MPKHFKKIGIKIGQRGGFGGPIIGTIPTGGRPGPGGLLGGPAVAGRAQGAGIGIPDVSRLQGLSQQIQGLAQTGAISPEVRAGLTGTQLTPQGQQALATGLETGFGVDVTPALQAAQQEAAQQFGDLQSQILEGLAATGGLSSSARAGRLAEAAQRVSTNVGIAGLRERVAAGERAAQRRLGALDPALGLAGLQQRGFGTLGGLEVGQFGAQLSGLGQAGGLEEAALRFPLQAQIAQQQAARGTIGRGGGLLGALGGRGRVAGGIAPGAFQRAPIQPRGPRRRDPAAEQFALGRAFATTTDPFGVGAARRGAFGVQDPRGFGGLGRVAQFLGPSNVAANLRAAGAGFAQQAGAAAGAAGTQAAAQARRRPQRRQLIRGGVLGGQEGGTVTEEDLFNRLQTAASQRFGGLNVAGRPDLPIHAALSDALTRTIGSPATAGLGLAKELKDLARGLERGEELVGPRGLSLEDIGADIVGIGAGLGVPTGPLEEQVQLAQEDQGFIPGLEAAGRAALRGLGVRSLLGGQLGGAIPRGGGIPGLDLGIDSVLTAVQPGETIIDQDDSERIRQLQAIPRDVVQQIIEATDRPLEDRPVEDVGADIQDAALGQLGVDPERLARAQRVADLFRASLVLDPQGVRENLLRSGAPQLAFEQEARLEAEAQAASQQLAQLMLRQREREAAESIQRERLELEERRVTEAEARGVREEAATRRQEQLLEKRLEEDPLDTARKIILDPNSTSEQVARAQAVLGRTGMGSTEQRQRIQAGINIRRAEEQGLISRDEANQLLREVGQPELEEGRLQQVLGFLGNLGIGGLLGGVLTAGGGVVGEEAPPVPATTAAPAPESRLTTGGLDPSQLDPEEARQFFDQVIREALGVAQ